MASIWLTLAVGSMCVVSLHSSVKVTAYGEAEVSFGSAAMVATADGVGKSWRTAIQWHERVTRTLIPS